MRSRLRLSEGERAREEETDRYVRSSGREGREDLRRSMRGGWEKEKEDRQKTRGGVGRRAFFFSTLRELAVELVYLTFVWHFPSAPLLLNTAPQSGPLHASLPATKKHPEPLLQSALPYTVTPTLFHPATSTALTWLNLSSISERADYTRPKLLWETVSGEWTNMWKEEFCCCSMRN